jgi:inosine/xanthosine triphosphate pyrophosphatase family protein
LGIFVNETNVEEFARLLEDRNNVERLLQRLETIELENQAKEKERKAAAKAAKEAKKK